VAWATPLAKECASPAKGSRPLETGSGNLEARHRRCIASRSRNATAASIALLFIALPSQFKRQKSMSIAIKICGITTDEAIEAAIDAGADYAGFVFFRKSPRNLSLRKAVKLARRAEGRIKTVALIVNKRDEAIDAIMAELRPDFLQLHGKEGPKRVGAIRRGTRARLIKAVRIGTAEDIGAAIKYEAVADCVLFDAQAPRTPNALPGGNGISFDWSLLPKARLRPNFMLSGGLNSDNVLAALSASGAFGVDVSSGVETVPGLKSPAMIRRFVEIAKSFKPSEPVPNRAA
jgi:phosphoribosylanthranilate isomerase